MKDDLLLSDETNKEICPYFEMVGTNLISVFDHVLVHCIIPDCDADLFIFCFLFLSTDIYKACCMDCICDNKPMVVHSFSSFHWSASRDSKSNYIYCVLCRDKERSSSLFNVNME